MSFFLVGIAGSAQDSEFVVGQEPLLIGSAPGNHVLIRHIAVAPRHCRLELTTPRIQNHDSKEPQTKTANGVLLSRSDPSAIIFVNGLPVTRAILHPEDTLQVGPATFKLESRDSAANPAVPNLVIDERHEFSPSLLLTREELLKAPVSCTDVIAPVNEPRAWKALVKIVTAVNAIEGLVALEGPLLEMLLEFLPIEAGAIMLRDSPSAALSPLCSWRNDHSQTVVVPRSLIQQTELGTAMLGELRTHGAQSNTRSVLAAPMMVFDHATGLIYLEGKENAFGRADLEFLFAIASNAATALEHARQRERLARENLSLRAQLQGEHLIVGEHPSLRKVYQQIVKAAPGNSTVLITGESGTGKELVARAIHSNSARSGKAFVAINCAALTETLLESELFGHEKGSFTGASSQRLGVIETADGGTLFLDEVSEMSPAMQTKLLRVLQEREFERVGGRRPIKVDVRVIAASNRDLEAAIKAGAFRQDLFYRLNVIGIRLPSLRERQSDIPLLAAHFAAKHAPGNARAVRGLSEAAKACLLNYSWPGNVRELENAIEHAIVLGESELIGPEDLPEAILEAVPPSDSSQTTYHAALRRTKRQLIVSAVAQANGSYVKAAQQLGVHPNYLHRLIRMMGLKPELEKRAAGGR
jgi:two-component system, NtrC family, response regulator HydG